MVPLLHFTSNITLTAATELVFGHGRVGGQDSCISNEKKQLILMGNLAGHEKKCHWFILLEALHWKQHWFNVSLLLTVRLLPVALHKSGSGQQTSERDIWVGPIFVRYSHLILCEASKSSARLTLLTCPTVPTFFPFSINRSGLYWVCNVFPFISLLDQDTSWIASLCYFSPPLFPLSTKS